MKIVAIGGGEIRERETLDIDRFICEFSGESHINALFLPTASYDAPGYIEIFHEIYGKNLGCTTHSLALHSSPPNSEIADRILSADIIYVGGGDTKTMLRLWQAQGVVPLLKRAADSGAVLSGLSAGAACWFEQGHSDYESFIAPNDWTYQLLPCLDMLPGVFCPHLDSEDRLQSFRELLKPTGLLGIGVDNNAAVWTEGDGVLQVITSTSQSTVTTIQNGKSDVWRNGDRFRWER